VMSMSMYVCVSVYPRAYLRNSSLIFINSVRVILMAVARSSSSGVAIRYVLPVLRITSCLKWKIMTRNRRRESGPHAN